MTVTVEEIEQAADVLERLYDEQAFNEGPLMGEETHFGTTEIQLRELSKHRKPKPWKPKVYVNHVEYDTSIYIEKPDGVYVGVYVGDVYRDSPDQCSVNRALSNFEPYGDLIYGGEE